MLVPILNEKGQEVGHYDTDLNEYYSVRDWDEQQILYKTLELCVSTKIIKELIRRGGYDCKIKIRVKNWEGNPNNNFYAITTVKEFLNHSRMIDYDKPINQYRWGVQRALHISFWKKIPLTQEKLEVEHEEY